MHKKYDGLGEPEHTWVEQHVQAIRATCAECGEIELRADHAGSIRGSKSQHYGTRASLVARNAEWQRLRESGLTLREVAEQVGAPTGTVASALWRTGAPRKGRGSNRGPQDADRAAEFIRLRSEEHLTYEQIAERYGVSRERVRQVLRQAGADITTLKHERLVAVGKKYQPRTCAVCHRPITSLAERDAGVGETHKEHVAKYHYPLMNLGTRSTPESNAKRAAIVVDYLAGMKEHDIQAKYGVEGTTITYALLQHGYTRNRSDRSRRLPSQAASRERANAVIALLRANRSKSSIASELGISVSRVGQIAQGAGLTRPKSA